MLKLFCLLFLISFQATAQEQLNWQSLEITVEEDEEEEEERNPSAFRQADNKFRSLMTDLKASVEKKERKRKRQKEKRYNFFYKYTNFLFKKMRKSVFFP